MLPPLLAQPKATPGVPEWERGTFGQPWFQRVNKAAVTKRQGPWPRLTSAKQEPDPDPGGAGAAAAPVFRLELILRRRAQHAKAGRDRIPLPSGPVSGAARCALKPEQSRQANGCGTREE